MRETQRTIYRNLLSTSSSTFQRIGGACGVSDCGSRWLRHTCEPEHKREAYTRKVLRFGLVPQGSENCRKISKMSVMGKGVDGINECKRSAYVETREELTETRAGIRSILAYHHRV